MFSVAGRRNFIAGIPTSIEGYPLYGLVFRAWRELLTFG